MIEHTPVIEDVTLTMIVRDEIINPAGGLLPVLELQAPHYPEVVIVDTGSVDGTRELLEHLSGRDFYPHIKVFDHRFNGYADARNFANSKVGTKYAMVVDADEIFFKQGIEKLAEIILNLNPLGVQIIFYNINIHNPIIAGYKCRGMGWYTRCYQTAHVVFNYPYGEDVQFTSGDLKKIIVTSHYSQSSYLSDKTCEEILSIHHFIPTSSMYTDLNRKSDITLKFDEWYHFFDFHLRENTPPSECKHFMNWKTPSVETLARYGINLDDVLSRLKSFGIKLPRKTKKRMEMCVKLNIDNNQIASNPQ